MKNYEKILIIVLFLVFLPKSLLAVEINFDSTGNKFLKGEDFVVSVKVNTGNEIINAIEGEIHFPENIVEIVGIKDGSSMLNFWLERPKEIEGNIVRFSGLTPGGFSGANNDLFSVTLQAKNSGQGVVSVEKIISLRNDGEGSRVPSSGNYLPLVVTDDVEYARDKFEIKDTELPESFTPIISQSPEIFNGEYFIVFATQDKLSGIDFYEIKEGNLGFFRKVTSPYKLRDQSLTKKIYIKAVDKAGNERLEIISARNPEKEYHNYNIFVILLLVFALLVGKKLWKRYINS